MTSQSLIGHHMPDQSLMYMLAWGDVLLLARPPVHGGLTRRGVRLVMVRVGSPNPITPAICKVILIRLRYFFSSIPIDSDGIKKGGRNVSAVAAFAQQVLHRLYLRPT